MSNLDSKKLAAAGATCYGCGCMCLIGFVVLTLVLVFGTLLVGCLGNALGF